MKISLEALKRYVEINVPVEELCDRMVMAGFEIEEMEKTMEGADFNKAKELLAYELTKLVHGEEEADKARDAAKAIFANGGVSENMPTTELSADELTDGGMGILNLLVKTKLAARVKALLIEPKVQISTFRDI